MGKLGNQPPRNSCHADLETFVAEIKRVAKSQGVSVDQVIAANDVLEQARRNDIAVQQGDYLDEQLGGFGEKLSELAQAISEHGMREPDEAL